MKSNFLIVLLICGSINAAVIDDNLSEYSFNDVDPRLIISIKDIVARQIEEARLKTSGLTYENTEEQQPAEMTIGAEENDVVKKGETGGLKFHFHPIALISSGFSSILFFIIYFITGSKRTKKKSIRKNLSLLRDEKLLVSQNNSDSKRKKNLVREINKKANRNSNLNSSIKKLNITHGEALLASRISELMNQQKSNG